MLDGDAVIQDLLITLVCLVSVITLTMLGLFFLKRRRQRLLTTKHGHSTTQLMPLCGSQGGKLDSSMSVPEIRIQFAENRPSQEDAKYPESICVVQVGESGAAFVTPLKQSPPTYADSAILEQLDLERIGGLRDLQDRQPLMAGGRY